MKNLNCRRLRRPLVTKIAPVLIFLESGTKSRKRFFLVLDLIHGIKKEVLRYILKEDIKTNELFYF